MSAYALANGATMFATAAGGLTNIGVAAAAAAGGFAAGGINGGNIQSALRGAFMAALTVGIFQGIESLASGAESVGSTMGANTAAVDAPSMPVSDASNTGMGSALPTSAAVQVERVVITQTSWTTDALDWLAKGPIDRNSASGAIWMGMMAMPGLSRGVSAARGATAGARRLAANQEIGRVGEKFLADTYGGSQQVTKSTTLGVRRLDNLADGVAMESKVGRTALTTRVDAQILKDVELMNNPAISGVYSVEWHFFPGSTGIGPTAPLLRRLEECLITVCIHR